MKVDDSQKKQLLVLCVLIVVAIGYGVMSLMGGEEAPVVPGGKNHSAKRAETPAAGIPAAGGAPEQAMAIAPLDTRDPFSPQVGPVSTAAKVPPPAPEPQIRPLAPMMAQPQVSPMPSLPGVQSAQRVDDLTKQFSVIGVIRGSRNVAVIKTGGGGSSIVREGQTIDGKYKVESISSGMVLIKHEGRSVVLRLGGNQVGVRM